MVNKVVDGVDKLFIGLSSLFLFVMTLLIACDALGRYLLHRPIIGVLEVTESFLMVGIVFLVMGHVYKIGKHVRVEFLSKYLPPSIIRFLWTGFDLLTFVLYFLIAVRAWEQAHNAWRLNQYTAGAVALPLFPAYLIVVAGTGLLCVRLLVSIVAQFAEMAAKKPRNR